VLTTLSVDDFSTDLPDHSTEVSFLSHCHTDHMKGLESYAGRIICSRVTREILLRLRPRGSLVPKYASVAKGMEVHPVDEPCAIEMGSRTLHLTMIDANHCSGAVMFLFECEGKAVLFTGDTRAEPWFVNSLVRNPSLMPYMKGFRKLDSIYIDSTFSYRLDYRFQNHYIEFPTNTDGTWELLKEIEKYPPHTKFYFATTYVMGFEDVWLMIYHKFNEKVYMNQHHREIFKAIAPYSQWGKELLKCLTDNPDSRFHGTCDRFCRCYETYHRVRVVPVTNKTSKEIQQDAQPIRVNDEFMTTKLDNPSFSVYYYDNPEPFYTEDDPNKYYILSKDKDCYLRTSIEFQYSRHSSMKEMVHLVSIFHPKTVYPFTATRADYLNGFRMEPIFGNVCDSGEFDYDIAMANDEVVVDAKYKLDHEEDKLIKASEKRRKGEVCDYSALSNDESDTDGESEEIHKMIVEQNRRKKRERTLASKQNTEEQTDQTTFEQKYVSEPDTIVQSDPNKILSSQVHENDVHDNFPPLEVYEQTSNSEKDTQKPFRKDSSKKRQSDDDIDEADQSSKRTRLQELHTNAVSLRRTKTTTEKRHSNLIETLTKSCPGFIGKLFKSSSITAKDEEEDNLHFEEISRLRNNLVNDECYWFKMSFDFEKT
jgi:hypothetical protein